MSVASRAIRRAVLLGPMAGFTACEVSGTIAPDVEPRAVVHAVLNPTTSQQIIIVERTLRSVNFGPEGPTRDPINDARVVIYGPREDSAVAVRDAAISGVYRISSITHTGVAGPNVLFLRPGDRYRLRVETSLGVVSGETTIPAGGTIDGGQEQFNLDRDTLVLSHPAQHAAGYLVRHETSSDARERFVTTLDDPLILPLAQAGSAADDEPWAFDWTRPWIRPGHTQTFAIIALDSNYFRYYVAGFDPFGDDTRGNTLTGGVGLFGSVSPIMAKALDLIADIDSPIEGFWQADRGSPTMPTSFTLYSSPHFPGLAGGGTSVSGRARMASSRILEATGWLNGNAVTLQFADISGAVQGVSATGLLADGTLVLTDTRSGERVTYRPR